MALGTDAEVLHNEIGLSNIRYRNNTVDIYLKKENDQLPEMYVKRRSLKKYSEPLFACEVRTQGLEICCSGLSKIFPFIERVLTEHKDLINSSDSKVQIYSIRSSRIRSRKLDIFEKP